MSADDWCMPFYRPRAPFIIIIIIKTHKHKYNESIFWLNYVHWSGTCLAKMASTISADTRDSGAQLKNVFILIKITSTAVHLHFASSFNRCAHKIHCTWVRELGMCARERKIIEESPEHFGWFRGTKNDAGRRAHGHHSMWSSANWPYFLNQIPNSAFTRMQASQLTDWVQAKKTCGIGAHRHRQNQLRKFN